MVRWSKKESVFALGRCQMINTSSSQVSSIRSTSKPSKSPQRCKESRLEVSLSGVSIDKKMALSDATNHSERISCKNLGHWLRTRNLRIWLCRSSEIESPTWLSMTSLRTDQSSGTEWKMKCKKSSLVGVFGLKHAKLLTSRSLPKVCSRIYKLSSGKRVDKTPRRSRVRSTILSDRMSLLERPIMRESDRRPQPKSLFSNPNKDLKLPNKRLKIMLKNWSLKRLEKNHWTIRSLPSRSKRESCMPKSSRSRSKRKRLKISSPSRRLRCTTCFIKSKKRLKMSKIKLL